MPPPDPTPLPNVAALLGRVLARVPDAQRPLLIALAERLAAERYRGWAIDAGSPERRTSLLDCADREEEIARRVESLFSDATAQQLAIREANPDLGEINRSVFAGRPQADQFAIQAQGERAGAALWRSLAETATSPSARDAYLQCARLEEESAAVLEAILSA
jgi:hypothetical protein